MGLCEGLSGSACDLGAREVVDSRSEYTHRLLSSSFLGSKFWNPIRQSQKGTTKEPMGRA